jgi:hypothetical protein
MRRTLGNRNSGLQCGMKDRLENLDFADDICLLFLCLMNNSFYTVPEFVEHNINN